MKTEQIPVAVIPEPRGNTTIHDYVKSMLNLSWLLGGSVAGEFNGRRFLTAETESGTYANWDNAGTKRDPFEELPAQPEPEQEWEALPAGTEPEAGMAVQINGSYRELKIDSDSDLLWAWGENLASINENSIRTYHVPLYRRRTPKPSVSEEFEAYETTMASDNYLSLPERFKRGTRVKVCLAEPLAGGEGRG